MKGFIDFVREQGVVGLAVGFILGGAVSKTVSSLVENVVNPLIGVLLGKVNLSDKVLSFGSVSLKYGAFLGTVVDFIVIAGVVYWGVNALGLNKLDKPKV